MAWWTVLDRFWLSLILGGQKIEKDLFIEKGFTHLDNIIKKETVGEYFNSWIKKN